MQRPSPPLPGTRKRSQGAASPAAAVAMDWRLTAGLGLGSPRAHMQRRGRHMCGAFGCRWADLTSAVVRLGGRWDSQLGVWEKRVIVRSKCSFGDWVRFGLMMTYGWTD